MFRRVLRPIAPLLFWMINRRHPPPTPADKLYERYQNLDSDIKNAERILDARKRH